MTEEKWEWRAGYDYATEKYKAEIDRLRAENAELRGLASDFLNWLDDPSMLVMPFSRIQDARNIIAKSQENLQ